MTGIADTAPNPAAKHVFVEPMTVHIGAAIHGIELTGPLEREEVDASQEFTRNITGLEPDESRALLEFLYEHCIRAEFSVLFRWGPGSIAFWDNRSTKHQAIRDVYDSDFEREFYRVALNGDIPLGVDGRPSTRLGGEPILPLAASRPG